MASARGLRIAMLAPISWRVPPRHYGPWEQFVSLLTEGLVRRGVDVTLFATADSVTDARLVASAPTGYSEDPGLSAKVWEALHISAVFERAGEFDVIHNSFDFLPLTYSDLVDTPVVTTIHGFSSEQIVPVFEKYNASGYYVAISDSDRHARLDYVATIHHGIDMHEFEPEEGPGDYLLFFGRIHPEKGTVEAIDVAQTGGSPADHRRDRSGRGVLRTIRQAPDRRTTSHVRRPRRPRPTPRAPRRCASAPPSRQLRRAVRLQRRRGDGFGHAGDRPSPRVDARDRPRRCERIPGRLSRGSGRRRPRVGLDGQGGSCARRSSAVSTPAAWSTTTSSSITASSRSTTHDEPAQARVADPRSPSERFRLGVNYWPARTAMRWWSDFDRDGGRRRFRADRRERSRFGQALLDLGRLPAVPDRGGSAHARAADRRRRSGRRSRTSRSFPRCSPGT